MAYVLTRLRHLPSINVLLQRGRLVFALTTVIAISACASESIDVSEVAMTDRVDAAVVGWTASEEGRDVFSPEDEEVIIKVLFNFNYRGVYEWYNIEWIAPGGQAYQVLTRRTDFGSHRDLHASMKIRGKMASRLPGVWKVRVLLQGREGAPDRELVSREFRIAQPTQGMLATGLTPVDKPAQDENSPLAAYAAPRAAQVVEKSTDNAVVLEKVDAENSNAVLPNAGVNNAAINNAGANPVGVLPPLAVLGKVTPPARASTQVLEQTTASKPVTKDKDVSSETNINSEQGPVAKKAPSVASASIASVSLTSLASDPRKAPLKPRRREYPACPPLYYRPGPGCVEQAPEE